MHKQIELICPKLNSFWPITMNLSPLEGGNMINDYNRMIYFRYSFISKKKKKKYSFMYSI